MKNFMSKIENQKGQTFGRPELQLTLASSLILSETMFAALRMPLFRATGLIPEVTARIPLFVMACVMIVEVVVPSPAFESLFWATS